ncbi:KR-domain-containing protein [Aspergillus ibericus CBS 121593]|uniref:KR-domain-containing protein n=1 Tax=Aspergillus ibericus CBS 121593 TaxID=1448316 RepID=A0A395HBG6_9EURO|nr:KR-domain-containing protein [Aspergillus ibericus CBS 121593]RAL03554.1 KR-domain-containing protein [Aspergillus ibericus CBS 121593]
MSVCFDEAQFSSMKCCEPNEASCDTNSVSSNRLAAQMNHQHLRISNRMQAPKSDENIKGIDIQMENEPHSPASDGDCSAPPHPKDAPNVGLLGGSPPKPALEELPGSFIPIAVVGMAMRLPGAVRTGDQFWDCLIRKEDGVYAFYHPTKEGCTKTKYGYFLKDDPACFDAHFFSIRDYEAASMGPQQRLLLELVWECLESAGETNWEGRDIGCFLGVFGEDWLGLSHRDPETIDRAHALSTGDYTLANCISYKYDFRGPSMTVQTACSSSLVAVHEACQALAAGVCSSAIVAGTNLIFSPTMTASLSSNMILQSISADPLGGRASARINRVKQHDTPYLIHPTMIDQCLQLVSVAGAAGIFRRIMKNTIPASIDRMFIGRGGDHMQVGVTVKRGSGNYFVGDATAMLDGKVVLSMKRGLLFSLGDQEQTQSIPLVAQMQWRPSIDFQHPQALLPHTELSVAQLAILEQISGSHLEKWMVMSSAEKDAMIGTLSSNVTSDVGIDGTIPVVCMNEIYANCQGIISNHVAPLDLLLDENRLGRYYAYCQEGANWSTFLTLLGHSKPWFCVLEVGASTGAATAATLQSLYVSGMPIYAKYVFTDITPSFLAAAQSRFERYQNIEYKILDISRDPLEQGFAAYEFDLVIASNVIHATPSLKHSLANVRKLLNSDGHFLLHELHSDILSNDYIMMQTFKLILWQGTLPGWWVGEKDGRTNRPYITPERWHQKLQSAGFTGTEATRYEFDAPYRSFVTMITRPSLSPRINPTVSLLVSDPGPPSPWANTVRSRLTDLGIQWNGQLWPTRLSIPLQASRCLVLWVTKSTQVTCWNTNFGLVPGFVRSIRRELVIDFCILEIESFDRSAAEAVESILQKISHSREASGRDLDYEFTLYEGTIHTSRCYWSLGNQNDIPELESELPKRIHIGRSGRLDSLRWREYREEDLGDDEVEIDIHYIGLNFRDILVALGYVGNSDQLGVEGSGTVRRVRHHVTDLIVGDQVLVLGPGLFGTRSVVNRRRCKKLDKGLSLEDAANMALVYPTAIYSLMIQFTDGSTKTVLVHSACGGFGMAAIQVCTLLGAEIFATVGNQIKRDHLIQKVNIPPDHMFDSRSASFLPSLMEATGGRGADIVLNSLAGNLLHASWECVAPFGKMIELGKRDFSLNGTLSLKPFLNNRAFIGVDLLEVLHTDPETIHREITQLVSWYEEGKILPIRPVRVFEARDVADAFRYMQQGTHMGKILVRMPQDSGQLPSSSIEKSASFHPEASYLLVGGLGGLGRAVSTWMVEKGARHLVYLSRNAGVQDDDKEFIHELEIADCHVQCVRGSVINLEDVQCAVARSKKPLKGVLQMSLCLRDGPFTNMSYEDWQASIAPKVQGTWNLHKAVAKEDLDFFVLFGSLVGLCGNTSQANYAAANSFLDGFSQYRRQLGLPSSVLALGAVGETGLITRQPRLLQAMKSVGTWLLGEDEVLKGLEVCILQSHAPSRISTSGPVIVGLGYTRPLSDPTVRLLWPERDARFASYANIDSISEQQSGEASSNLLRDLVREAERDPSIMFSKETIDLIMKETARMVCAYLAVSQDLDEKQKLDVVIDSLASIKIKSWVQRNLGLEISMPDIAKSRTVRGLAQLAVGRLKAHFKAKMDMEGAHEETATEVPN